MKRMAGVLVLAFCALLVKPFGADQLKAAVALARAAGRRAPPS